MISIVKMKEYLRSGKESSKRPEENAEIGNFTTIASKSSFASSAGCVPLKMVSRRSQSRSSNIQEHLRISCQHPGYRESPQTGYLYIWVKWAPNLAPFGAAFYPCRSLVDFEDDTGIGFDVFINIFSGIERRPSST